jgi:PIN domain nuclease of toxin-antitoxin system
VSLVLDTCAWLWYCAEPKKLSRVAREAIQREKARAGLIVSVISCWEIAKLVQKGKLKFSIRCREWIEFALQTEGISLYALTPEIAVESAELPGSFGGDPADQIIVATARALGVAVLTKDRKILDYPHVPSLW